MTREELINQRKKEIAELTSQIDKSKINYNLPMGSWVSYKESEISDRERMSIDESINQIIDSLMGKKANLLDHSDRVALTDALNTMRKYQQIVQIYQKWNDVNDFSYNQAMQKIGEVVEDGTLFD